MQRTWLVFVMMYGSFLWRMAASSWKINYFFFPLYVGSSCYLVVVKTLLTIIGQCKASLGNISSNTKTHDQPFSVFLVIDQVKGSFSCRASFSSVQVTFCRSGYCLIVISVHWHLAFLQFSRIHYFALTSTHTKWWLLINERIWYLHYKDYCLEDLSIIFL